MVEMFGMFAVEFYTFTSNVIKDLWGFLNRKWCISILLENSGDQTSFDYWSKIGVSWFQNGHSVIVLASLGEPILTHAVHWGEHHMEVLAKDNDWFPVW